MQEGNIRESPPPSLPRVELATAQQREQYDTNYATGSGGEANSESELMKLKQENQTLA